jgi:hypothetical protein
MRTMQRAQVLATIFWLLFATSAARASGSPEQAAHQFFQAVTDGQFPQAWSLLTRKTQDALVQALADKTHLAPAIVREAFRNNSSDDVRAFWGAFRVSAKAPQFAAIQFGKADVDGKMARVLIPGTKVNLLMFDEGGWKFGLQESFYPNGFSTSMDMG